MSYNFIIAPDFPPNLIGGWQTLNTLLQKRSNLAIHLITPSSATEQNQTIDKGDVSIVYANPFDAATLIREKGYKAIARPVGKSDEMVIISAEKGDIKKLDDLKPGVKIAMADNRDVKLIGLRLLEAVDLTENDIKFEVTDSYQAAAKQVIQGNADAAFFIAEIYHSLSNLTKMQLTVLIESNLADITHVLLVKEDFSEADAVRQVLLDLGNDDSGKSVLAELGMPNGFEAVSEEQAEFMIDLMDTLLT